MNRNRHYLKVSILITLLFVVSIFLFSCGIPTFCTLDNISLNGSNRFFSISGSDTDLSKVEIGPGVLICYVVGDSEIPDIELTNSNGIIKEFKNLTDTNKLFIDSDNSILSITTDQSKHYILYAFNNKNDQTVNKCKNPLYNIDLRENYIKGISIDCSFNLNDFNWDNNGINIVVKDSNGNTAQNLYANLGDNTGSYIYIYVAFSAEVGNFSNNYWSKLCYIGSISKSK